LEVEKLKEMPRTGWVLRNVKNPETVAEHAFRVAILAWLLSEKKNLNIGKTIKIALVHDCCKVYSGDLPHFLYYVHSPKIRWARLSRKEKEKRGRKKFELERNSLLKLLKFLNPRLKKEIFSHWLTYERKIIEKRIVRGGNFVEQVHRMETLIQSIEYFGTNEKKAGTTWWEFTEEIIDDPLVLDFSKVIQKKFYGKTVGKYKKDDELENILDFILKIGKLKRMPRTIWVSMGVKNPETVAGHVFTTALMTWAFGIERKEINLEKSLKMALCHEFPSVYTGDLITPFSLPKEGEKIKIFERWPRMPKIKKEKIFFEDYQKERKAIEKLTVKLEPDLKKEIVGLWEEYKMNLTPEALFVNQINVLAVLLEALLYQKKDKNLPVGWIWEWAFEKCECPIILKFLEELKEKFYKKSLIQKAFLKLFFKHG
jgi:putative hydrolase of HD superfamily